jgi:hypothetical protein
MTAHHSRFQIVWPLRGVPTSLRRFISRVYLGWHRNAGFRYDDIECWPISQAHLQGWNDMNATLFAEETTSFICKHLDKLPPVVSDWQQCQQPRCSHYCAGKCCNSGRLTASAPCPFDATELPLEDAKIAYFDDDAPGLNPLWPSLHRQRLPKKG